MGPSISAIRVLNASFSPSYLPVAVFVGGTSGIGQRLSLVPRMATHILLSSVASAAGAFRVIAGFPLPSSPSVKHELFACDVTLMKNVQRTTRELLSRTSRVDFFVVSPGLLTLSGRDKTEEGIDKKLAVHYCAGWNFIHGLFPAFVQAREADEDAKAFSVCM